MSDCVFCKIIAGSIPSSKVFENDKVLACLDIGPIALGHTLVLPKAHHEILTDLPADLLKDTVDIVYKVAPAVVKGMGAEGFNLLVNNKKCAGQAIAHVHFHIIPRKTDDGVKFNWSPKKYAEGEMQKTLDQIKGSMG